jgi:membrane-bound lytic murein transglycosylase D
VDERKDPEKATVAAARYLKHLYGIFGDWPLALASYNAGEGTIMRAIQHQGTTNYWELHLPKQTEDYVPQFMAALAISRDPVKYGFGDIELDDPMRFDEVAMKGAVDLHAIAKLAECSYDELKELNPSARSSMLRGQNGITTVRVPEGKSELIQKNLAADVELPTVNLTVRHRVRRGETLRMIAGEYSVNPTELARVNNLGRGRPLRRGMLLTVPASFRAPRPEVISPDAVEDPRASTDYVPQRRIGLPGKIEGNSVVMERVTHTVKRGETLRSIAAKYDVTVSELKRWNRITTQGVKLGTRLRIRDQEDSANEPAAERVKADEPKPVKKDKAPATPAKADDARKSAAYVKKDPAKDAASSKPTAAVAMAPSRTKPVVDAATLDTPAGGRSYKNGDAVRVPAKRTHTVRTGETLADIARRHNVSADDLRKLNSLRGGRLTPGQRLILPA